MSFQKKHIKVYILKLYFLSLSAIKNDINYIIVTNNILNSMNIFMKTTIKLLLFINLLNC